MLHDIKLHVVVDLVYAAVHELVQILLSPCVKNVAVEFDVGMGRGKDSRNAKDGYGCLFYVFICFSFLF